MNGVINRLDHRGHGEVTRWSDDQISQAEAERVFRDHQSRFYTMADMTHGVGTVMKDFDPEVTEILAVPPMIRG